MMRFGCNFWEMIFSWFLDDLRSISTILTKACLCLTILLSLEGPFLVCFFYRKGELGWWMDGLAEKIEVKMEELGKIVYMSTGIYCYKRKKGNKDTINNPFL